MATSPTPPQISSKEATNPLLEDLLALERRYDENQFVHDCAELADLIARHTSAIGNVLLLGFWLDPKDSKTYVIRSASFLIGDGRYQTIDAFFKRGVHYTETETSIPSIERRFNFTPQTCESEVRSNVRCHFIHPQRGSHAYANFDAIRDAIASLYQRLLISSQNFANFIDGQIYRRSKPDVGEFHPRFRTYSEIADAIKENYNVRSSYFVFVGSRDSKEISSEDLRHPDGSGIDRIVTFFRDELFQRKLELSIQLKQPIVGATQKQLHHYCLFPAFDPSIRQSPIEGLLIIWSSTRLAIPTYRATATWLKEFSALRHIKKAGFLSDLRQHIEKELRSVTEFELPGRKERLQSVSRISSFLCKNLCELTNAEAATLRLRHDTQRILRSYGWWSTPLANEGRPAQDIKIDDWARSAIAFSFKYESTSPYLYFENMEEIPTIYKRKGLSKVLKHWKSMRSEAVIRVQRGGLLAAAINVESPIEGAFHDELDFLESCGAIMSDYLTRLEAVGDRSGLASMADTQLAIHSIKSFISNWKPPSTYKTKQHAPEIKLAVYICKRLKENVVQRSSSTMMEFADRAINVSANDSVRVFNSVLRNRFKTYLNETGSDRKLSSVLSGKIPSRFPTSDLSSLVVIMDSIWGNIIRHTQLQKNRLEFEELCQPYGKRRVLMIHWTAPSRLPASIDRDQLFLRPILLDDGPHFGFFLIGVHTRLLGGHVEYEEHSPSRRGFSVRAFIPYDESPTEPPSDERH
jgi:hypothetical protein